ncbi:MAG TPA: AAA family ATPase [Acidimicrobiales bacterium]|jgi:AAA15 family ATPase/GTPase|nr:AAA family ATPase [Acidimicrobiales bacterium]
MSLLQPVLETPRIESLRVRNYRVLHDLELKKLTPLSVLLGPNGSGKSTLFDVFAFLSECFTVGLRRAWDRRNRFKEMRSRARMARSSSS